MLNQTLPSNNTLPIPQPCITVGNSDLYGLGIRIGFYLQWYAARLASAPKGSSGKIASEESQGLGFSNIVFSVATFLGLITQTSNLQLSEIYIVLLLVSGYHYYFIPQKTMALIRFLQQLLKKKDPKTQEQRGWVYNLLVGLLFCAISCFQLWFWGGHFQHRDGNSDTCPDYGFGFVRVDLNNTGFRAFNIIYWVLLLILSLLIIWYSWSLYHAKSKETKSFKGTLGSSSSSIRSDNSSFKSQNENNFTGDFIESVLLFIFATIMIVAIEISITWNQITGVTELTGAGQLIPFLMGLGSLLRVCYIGVSS